LHSYIPNLGRFITSSSVGFKLLLSVVDKIVYGRPAIGSELSYRHPIQGFHGVLVITAIYFSPNALSLDASLGGHNRDFVMSAHVKMQKKRSL
jgi:hypothetical protein